MGRVLKNYGTVVLIAGTFIILGGSYSSDETARLAVFIWIAVAGLLLSRDEVA